MNRCPSTFAFPGFKKPAGEGDPEEWYIPAGKIRCDLEEGHHGYHFGGPNGIQAWPPTIVITDGLIAGGFRLYANDEISIRPLGAFCVGKTIGGEDCMLRFQHLGPHARPGKIWA